MLPCTLSLSLFHSLSLSHLSSHRFLPDVVLYPRHVITLQFCLPNELALLERVLTSPSKLIVVCGRKERGSTSIGSVGVTAELRGVRRGSEGAYARALGCQRCKLERMEKITLPTSEGTGEGMERSRQEMGFIWRVLSRGDPGPIPTNFLIGSSYWSEAETRRYNARAIMLELIELARRLVPTLASEVFGSPGSCAKLDLDPDLVSWRLAWNLPMSTETKLEVLSCLALYQRLGKIADFLRQQDGVLGCARCSSVVSHSQDLLHRTDEGCSGLFVNQHGWIHDMITTSSIEIESVSFSGLPTEEFTWFKGYSWQIFGCRKCGLHLGWRYTSRDEKAVPLIFYGLRRQSIRTGFEPPRFVNEDENEEEEAEEEGEEAWFSPSSGSEDEEGEREGGQAQAEPYLDFPYVARFDR